MRRGAHRDIITKNAREFPGREYRNARGGTLEEAAVTGRLIQVAKSAYQYPLILKQLWHAPIVQAPDQEVVYRDLKRFTYRDIRERIGRLASALHGIGVRAADTVGVLDWDSNRFLEAFFAIRARFRGLLHHEIQRNRDGAVDLPVDHRCPWRAAVDRSE